MSCDPWSNWSFAVGLALGAATVGSVTGVYILDLLERIRALESWRSRRASRAD